MSLQTGFSAHRGMLAVALLANTLVCVTEVYAGWHANSLALLVDAVHNAGDELALACLLAAALSPTPHRRRRAIATALSTAGIALIALIIVGAALLRLVAPPPVAGPLILVAALGGALGNGCVACALARAGRDDPAVRLACLHNQGDVLLCLSTAVAAALITLGGWQGLDCLFAMGAGLWLLWGALAEIAPDRHAVAPPHAAPYSEVRIRRQGSMGASQVTRAGAYLCHPHVMKRGQAQHWPDNSGRSAGEAPPANLR